MLLGCWILLGFESSDGLIGLTNHGLGSDSSPPGQEVDLGRVDRVLIDECLAGNADAWTRLYQKYQPRLLASIRASLASTLRRNDVIDEVASRVWYAVVSDNARLLARFAPGRNCQLGTYLSMLATTEVLRYLRSERRQQARNAVVGDRVTKDQAVRPGPMLCELDEFLDHLTPQERAFCKSELLDISSEMAKPYSDQNAWQLRHRVLRKLRSFMHAE